MRCPRCEGRTLSEEKIKSRDIFLGLCRKCLGIWFDANELGQILNVAAKDLEPPRKSTERSIQCPKCFQRMTAFHYPQTLVVIDMCKTCNGIWLDGREFAEIKTIRENLRKRDLLEEYAPVHGLKGVLLRFINSAINQLKPWD